jgi:hypothetical protein
VYVRDAYVGGRPQMRGSVLGLYKVVDERGGAALTSAELHRYLAETIWFPTALLPGHGVTWQPIDTKSAVATLHDGATSVSVRFLFTPDGDVREVFALDRMRAIDGRYEPTPWAVSCDDYQVHQDVRFRSSAVNGCCGWSPAYWRGRVTNVDHQLAR